MASTTFNKPVGEEFGFYTNLIPVIIDSGVSTSAKTLPSSRYTRGIILYCEPSASPLPIFCTFCFVTGENNAGVFLKSQLGELAITANSSGVTIGASGNRYYYSIIYFDYDRDNPPTGRANP